MSQYRFGRALIAGIIAGLIVVALLLLAQLLRLTRMNLPLLMGSMFTRSFGVPTWVFGFVLHLVLSGLIALLYALGFHLLQSATWLVGLLGAVPHVLIAGAMMAMMPALHPLIPEQIPPPGFLSGNLGASAVLTLIVVHLAYGAFVGAFYRIEAETG